MAQPLYKDLVIADGARNYWRLGESSGTSAVDVVSGVNGTISGGVTLAQAGALGDGDKAMGFNGTTGQVVTAASVPIVTPCTVEGWFKFTTGNMILLSTRAGYPTKDILLLWAQSTNGFPLMVLDYANATSPEQNFGTGFDCRDGRWHHVVAVLTPLNCDLYLDGVFAGPSHPLPAPFTGSTTTFAIGQDTFNGFTSGSLDEVAVYPYALTAAQIAAHYTARTLPYVPGTYPARVIASGPSNYWRLGEASGATAVDLVGGANGTISGGVTLGQKGALSEPDTAMGFDGVSGKVTTPSVLLPNVYTIEVWAKFTAMAQLAIVSNRNAGGATFVGVVGGGMFFYNGAGPNAPHILNDGQWHHLVYVINGANCSEYLDGVFEATGASVVLSENFVLTFAVDSGAYFPGSIDDIAIYPRALPAQEILDHYNAKLADIWDPRLYPPSSPPTTGPVAYPAVTSPYPQSGQPSSAPRPAPTLATLTPSSATTALGFQRVDLTGTNFTNASKISLAGVLDQFRVDETILYRDPTSLQITLDLRGLVAGAYQLGVVNQDSQASATLPFTVS